MSFKVCIEPSKHSFTVEPEEAILDAALRQGIALPYGCRSGSCGSCKGRVVEGRVSYEGERPPALSEQEQSAGLALFCQARAMSDLIISCVESKAGVHDKPRRFPARVERKELLAPDVVRLYLKLPNNVSFSFLAGQYIDFILQDGRHRSFSLANQPGEDDLLELHIRHVEGGEFTEQVFMRMKERDMVRLEGPYGNFYLREESPRPVILVAGGTGFAPIKGIIERALHIGHKPVMHLYWGVRARRDLYLDELPRAWEKQSSGNFHYTPVLSASLDDDHWSGRTGFVHDAMLQDYADLSAYDIYASGPPVMVRATYQACIERGMPPEHFYSDSFEFAADTQMKLAKKEG